MGAYDALAPGSSDLTVLKQPPPSSIPPPAPAATTETPVSNLAPPATGRTMRILGRTYTLVLPSIRDPRLHLAAVIVSIHVLGQLGLGFRVSVPQILSAIVVCAVIEVIITLYRTGTLAWPASAMLTG